jgi:4-hydroxybenzoate polyprenyltransferase
VQDSVDDARIGVKSTVRRMGRQTHLLVLFAYVLATALFALLMARWQVGDRAALAVIAFAVHTLWQWRSLHGAGEDAPERAGRWFTSNATLGLIVFVLLLSDRYML